MNSTFENLLAADLLARKTGGGLKPALRLAMEASLRFPAKAASPVAGAKDVAGELPVNVVRLPPLQDLPERKPA